MTLDFPVTFDRPITSTVTAVLIPVDRFSRREIPTGIDATLLDPVRDRSLPYRLLRNRRGYLVLADQPSDVDHTFLVDPGEAGYLGPIEVIVNPDADGVSRIVWLDPTPGFPFEPGTTLVRGTVTAAGTGLGGAVVAVEGERYQTGTDDRGSFALAVRLPAPAAGEATEPVDVDLRFEHPDHGPRTLGVTLTEGRTHVFTVPIELDGGNEPPFAEP